jgi:predicted transposase/invertase (TIGR01784 family)
METNTKNPKLLDPTNDLVFKYYFSKPKNKSILISFIEAVIEPEFRIDDLEVLNPNIDKDNLDDKAFVLDLLVRFKDGSKVDVEMQVARTANFRSRVLQYWIKVHGSQVKIGDDYDNICPTITICVLGYNEFLDNDDELHSLFFIKENRRNTLFLRELEMHFLELPKYEKWKRKYNDKNLESWSRFLKLKTASEAEIEELKKEPEMENAIKALEELSQDAKLQELMDQREKNQIAHRLILSGTFAEGKAEGVEQERNILIKNAAKNGLTVEIISKVLEIPVEIVQEALKF